MQFIQLLVLIVVNTVTSVRCTGENVVSTKSGDLRGIKIESDISDFFAYLGVPYAKPPIGDLRFKPPQPVEPWQGIRDATREVPACSQPGHAAASEDCLTLTVYTRTCAARRRAVLVWLHGGALETGSASLAAQGPHYFMQHDIVVVTVQFRLGILGFLNLGDADAPGNMGLMDVVQALRWIQENIEQFGGDPGAITLAGHSSGAIMVHTLLLLRISEGLFHQVIIQSGTALSYRFYDPDATVLTPKILQMLKTNSSDELLEQLKTLDTTKLLDIQEGMRSDYIKGYATYIPFVITGQSSFLSHPPLELLREGNYKAVPMMIGFTSDEGIRLETQMEFLDQVNENFHIVVPTDMFDADDLSERKLQTADTIKRFYFGERNLSHDTFPEYAELCRDSWYAHITDYVVRWQSTAGYTSPVYYYVFGVDGPYNIKYNNGITSPGPSHGDELGYLWKSEVLSHVPADDMSDMTRERMVTLWSNFVKFGNPTPEVTKLIPVAWAPVDYPNVTYLLINQTLSLEEAPLRENMLFWQQLYRYDKI